MTIALATTLAHGLRPHAVTAVALEPGFPVAELAA